MGCSTSLAKLVLFVFNVVFFLFGVVSLSIGIWSAANKSELFKLVNLIDSHVTNSSNTDEINAVADHTGLIQLAGIILICLGVFTLLVGFCGCFGAMKESKCLLTVYCALVGLILVAEFAVGIAAAVFRGRIQSEASGGLLRLQSSEYVALPGYNGGAATGVQNSITLMLNYMQLSLECCGVLKVGDVANSSSWLASNRQLDGKQMVLPFTCCKVKDREAMLKPTYDWKSVGTFELQDPSCPFNIDSPSRHNVTCPASMIAYINKFASPLIWVCVLVAIVELVGILLACCLIRAVDNDKNYAK